MEVLEQLKHYYHLFKTNPWVPVVEALMVGVFFLWFFGPELAEICTQTIRQGFDGQNVYMWNVGAWKGVLPYKEAFYPYGIWAYYKEVVFELRVVEVILLSGVMVGLYMAFQWISHSKLLAAIYLFWVFYGVSLLFSTRALARYGLGLLVVFFGIWMLSRKKVQNWSFMVLGVVCGVLFSLVPDQGMYVTLSMVVGVGVSVLADPAHRTQHTIGYVLRLSFWKVFLARLGLFGGGFGVGLLPVGVYLLWLGILDDFVRSFGFLSEISQYAKTPFYPASTEMKYLATTGVYWISGFWVCAQLFFLKARTSYRQFLALSMITVLFACLNYKNVIRVGFTYQMIPVTLVALIIILEDLVAPFRKVVEGWMIRVLKVLTMVLVALIISSFTSVVELSFGLQRAGSFVANGGWSTYLRKESFEECRQETLAPDLTQFHPRYITIRDFIHDHARNKGVESSIFSYPGDPIWYMVFDQQPPYYFNGFDASSLRAQETLIEYMETNSIQYVLYSNQNTALMDTVPNHIRNAHLIEYLSEHYTTIQEISGFVTMERK